MEHSLCSPSALEQELVPCKPIDADAWQHKLLIPSATLQAWNATIPPSHLRCTNGSNSVAVLQIPGAGLLCGVLKPYAQDAAGSADGLYKISNNIFDAFVMCVEPDRDQALPGLFTYHDVTCCTAQAAACHARLPSSTESHAVARSIARLAALTCSLHLLLPKSRQSAATAEDIQATCWA